LAEERYITLEVTRYRPEEEMEPTTQSYTIPFREDMVVLDALNYIKDEQDGTLSYRWSCRMGICGSCGMVVNGRPRLTCATFLREFYPNTVRVEPLTNFPIVRDLVVDINDFIEKLGAIQPWIVREQEKSVEEGFYLQSPAELERYHQYSKCINCLLCYAACPVYGDDPDFLGPAAIALAHRYDLDSRDQGRRQRVEILASDEGAWHCTYVGECSVVCPKGVDPSKAIQEVKLENVLRRYAGLVLPWAKR
jgi:fumarate reductase iron-sulfur subunit